jgi:hypothetical protein
MIQQLSISALSVRMVFWSSSFILIAVVIFFSFFLISFVSSLHLLNSRFSLSAKMEDWWSSEWMQKVQKPNEKHKGTTTWTRQKGQQQSFWHRFGEYKITETSMSMQIGAAYLPCAFFTARWSFSYSARNRSRCFSSCNSVKNCNNPKSLDSQGIWWHLMTC